MNKRFSGSSVKYLGQCYCNDVYDLLLFELGGIYDYYLESDGDIWVVSDYSRKDPNMGRRFKKDMSGTECLSLFSDYFISIKELRRMKLEEISKV